MANEELELPAGCGVPSGSLQKFETWKLKPEDDTLVLRILPSMKSLLKKDDFGLYWGLHFGWNGINAKDPTKKMYRPFLCIKEKNYGMVTVECPACTYRNTYIEKAKAAEAAIETQVQDLIARGKAHNAPEAEINKQALKLKEKLISEAKPLKEWVNAHGLDGKFRIPCINKQGQFGIFLAPYGVVQKLRAKIAELRNENYPGTDKPILATGRKGVWFKIKRTGKASTTSDDVTVNRIALDNGAEMKDFHVITNEQLEEAQNRIPDLAEFRDSNRIRLDQMEALIELDKAGGGSSDPTEVDRILEIGKKKEKQAVESEPDWMKGSAPSNAPAQETPATPTPPPPETASKNPVSASNSAPEVKSQTPTPATSTGGDQMSDEDFNSLWT
jgi:hypothetical protein